jgi:tetratricopeptide (TPR) repeat protein
MKKISVILLLLSSFYANASNRDSLFAKANLLYVEMQYQYAANIYKQLLNTEPKNFNILYNSGNAFVKLKQYGKGIWCYRNALLLNPSNEPVLINMSLALAKCNTTNTKSQLNFISASYKIARFLDVNESALLLLFGAILFSIFYCLSILLKSNNILKTIFKCCKYLFSVIISYLLFQFITTYFIKEAVLFSSSPIYKNQQSNVKIEVLEEGNTVLLIKRNANKISSAKRIPIYLEKGNEGWIDSENIGLVE